MGSSRGPAAALLIRIMKSAPRSFAVLFFAILTLPALMPAFAEEAAPAFQKDSWSVRCWNGETRRWEDLGIGKVEIAPVEGATRITNTSGIHRHAHLVHPAVPEGDFVFTIELRGGYELGFLNAAGKDEMLYVELAGKDGAEPPLGERPFHRYEISREGTRFTIRRDGRPVPMVHFQFDYGEDFIITLAVREGESVEIRSASMKELP